MILVAFILLCLLAAILVAAHGIHEKRRQEDIEHPKGKTRVGL